MAELKRLKRIWTGTAWVDVYAPTSDDLVVMEGGGTLRAWAGDVDEHMVDGDLHKSSTDRTKLGNLPNDANGTFATQTQLTTHAGDADLHKTANDRLVLADLIDMLPDLPSEVFATKEELAGATTVLPFDDIEERDQFDTTGLLPGAQAWVRDPSDDTDNINREGTAIYVWTGEEWTFVYQFGGDVNIVHDWNEIVNGPASSAANIDDAVAKRHEHLSAPGVSNLTVLNGLTDGGANGLLYNGVQVGGIFNRTYISDNEPATPNVGDTWLAPLTED